MGVFVGVQTWTQKSKTGSYHTHRAPPPSQNNTTQSWYIFRKTNISKLRHITGRSWRKKTSVCSVFDKTTQIVMEWGHQMTAACTWGGHQERILSWTRNISWHEKAMKEASGRYENAMFPAHDVYITQSRLKKSEENRKRIRSEVHTLWPTKANCFPACRTTDYTW